MRFPSSLRSVAAALLLVLAGVPAASAGDVPGSKDHPAVSRYPGSTIAWYDVQAFQPYAIATGPVTGYREIADWTETQGRTTRIYYELEGQNTHSEVYANYKKALEDAGFSILADGLFTQSSRAAEVGSRKWLGVYFSRNTLPPDGIRLLHGSSTSGGSGFLAATKERAAGTLYVAVTVTQYAAETVTALIDVVEVDKVETDLVTVNAEAMGADIDEYGRVTLDGLFFDHDKASLTAQSAPALAEIAKFLAARPDLSFFVVGHTDGSGTFAYNRSLSERRAASVIEALVEEHGVPAERLEAHGVGPLVPVFSNGSEGGRTKNRRVELVERP
jgi:outer membrane protein OmpA-like peptidoglycan-associated protein